MTNSVPTLEIGVENVQTIALHSPRPPKLELEAPGPSDILVVPNPGPPGRSGIDGKDGKDGSVVGAEGLTYRHNQNNPEQNWVIHHTLVQEVSACHVVISGEPIIVPWMETGDHEVTIYFQGACSGYAVIS